ncbi:MAG TPA: cation transporter, partial [Anaerolineales bacterium]|nr:cation transporter [Anaerolineales bacterium]
MTQTQILEVPIGGMDCTECTQHVQHAIAALPGVESVDVFLASEKAIVRLDPLRVTLPTIRKAVEGAGYSAPDSLSTQSGTGAVPAQSKARPERSRWGAAVAGGLSRRILALFGLLFGAVLFIVVFGEWLGLFEQLTERVPFVVGLSLVVLVGWPIFVNVIRATLKRQITSHTLMTLGVIAALAIGEWAT